MHLWITPGQVKSGSLWRLAHRSGVLPDIVIINQKEQHLLAKSVTDK